MPREDKRQKCRYWMLTGFDSEPSFDQFTMSAMLVGREICPNTKKEHYHACIQFVSEIRVTTIKKIFPKQNLVMKKDNKAEFFAYSKKDGDFTDYGIADHGNQGERGDFTELIESVDEGDRMSVLMIKHPKVVARHMSYTKLLVSNRKDRLALEKRKSKFDKPLKPWHQRTKEIIEREVCDRSVYWLYDESVGAGKSFMSGYLQTHHNAFIISGDKTADIAHAYDEQPVVVFDLPRTIADHMDHIYSVIESLKNGCIFSPKYESRTKMFDTPHVIVFAHFKPDLTKLSEDRWKVSSI
jgi:hypothetical protein